MRRLSLLQSDLKPLRAVPVPLRWLLLVLLVAQTTWHHLQGDPSATVRPLHAPPSSSVLEALALSDDAVLARLMMLWLHAHDTQPGVSLPFNQLDYDLLIAWLSRIEHLDPRSQVTQVSALRVYGAVSDRARQRQMLEFVHRSFLQAPDRRWRWLAEAVIVAKHRLKDLDLALRYARSLRRHATGPQVPYWARDLEVVVLEDMGELEAARILVGGLLASGELDDPVEIRYLEQKLKELQQGASQEAPRSR